MAIDFENPVVGGTVLIREDIESQNFVTGISGWEIRADGSAEFNNVVIRGGIVVGGTALYYDGTPGPNTLVASISAVAGIDPFGNGFGEGICSYDRNLLAFSALQGGFGYFGNLGSGSAAPSFINAGVIQSNTSSVTISSPDDGTLNNDRVSIGMSTGITGVRTGDNNVPNLRVSDNVGQSMADIVMSGSVYQSGMTWKTPIYTADFAGGSTSGTFQPLQYRVDAQNNLFIEGAFHAINSTTNAIVFTLPATVNFAKFRPVMAHMVVVGSDSSAGVNKNAGATIQVNNTVTGTVRLRTVAATAVNDNFYVSAFLPLGDIQ